MSELSIEICRNRADAEKRKVIIKAGNPDASWNSRIIEGVDFVMSYLVLDTEKDPTPQLPPVYTEKTPDPKAPCVVLIIWVEE